MTIAIITYCSKSYAQYEKKQDCQAEIREIKQILQTLEIVYRKLAVNQEVNFLAIKENSLKEKSESLEIFKNEISQQLATVVARKADPDNINITDLENEELELKSRYIDIEKSLSEINEEITHTNKQIIKNKDELKVIETLLKQKLTYRH